MLTEKENQTTEPLDKKKATKPISSAERMRENIDGAIASAVDASKPKVGERKNIIFKRTVKQFDEDGDLLLNLVRFPQMDIHRAVVWLEHKNKTNLKEKIEIAYNPRKCIAGPSVKDIVLTKALDNVESLMEERKKLVANMKKNKKNG